MIGVRIRILKAVLSVILSGITSAAQAPSNGPVSYIYDELGRLVAVIDGSGNAGVYSYDAVGNIVSISRYASTQVSVISFSPMLGAVGSSVTIYGTGFSSTTTQNSVQFNGVVSTVVSASSNQLMVTVPSGATTGAISVTAPLGSATSSTSFTVISGPGAPSISGFSPAIATAGTAITITGSGFDPVAFNNRLTFNTTPSIPSSATATSVIAPFTSLTSSGRIRLTTAAGTAVSGQDIFVPFTTHSVADVAYTARTAIGSSQTVSLPTANTIGLLLFDGTQGQQVSLAMSNSTFGSTCNLYLFAPDTTQLVRSNCYAASTTPDSVVLPTTGTYTIGIEPITSTGSFVIGISDVSDVRASMLIDGPPVAVTTSVPRQDARLSFNGTANGRVFLQITNVTNPAASVHLVKPDGESISTFTGISNSPAGQLFTMDTQTLPTSGTYDLWVQHGGTGTGSETLQLTSVPPDFISSIALGGAAVRVPDSGNTAIGQNAYLNFNANAGQKVSMNVTNGTYSPSTACQLRVNGPSGFSATNYICGSGAPSFIDTIALTYTGAYTIFVDPQSIATGTTTLKLNDAADVTGTIAIDGSAVTATTTVPGQDARLAFTATAGQRVVLQVSSVSNPNAIVYLLRPDGSTQTSVGISNSAQIFFMDTQTLAVSGAYTLWVKHTSSYVGSETLQLSSVPPDFTAPITIGGAGVRFPASGNNALGQNGSLTFSANAGQKVSISISGSTLSPASACVLTLKDASGNHVTSGNCGSPMNPPYIDTVTLNATGTDSIFLDPQGMAVGTVTITLNDDTDATGAVSIDGPPVTTTTIIGQDARLSFSATAGQRLVLQVTNVSNPGAFVNLLRPDGTTQANLTIQSSPAGQTFFIDTQTLASAGTYTLWIQHSGANFGSETLQLSSVPPDYTGTLTINGGAVPVPATGSNAIGQNASITFSAAAGQSLKINLSNSTYSPYYACQLTLKNPSGGTVTSGYCGNGAATPISTTAPSTGTYTIVIDPQGTSTGSLSISVTSP